jgi:hypothetical protein
MKVAYSHICGVNSTQSSVEILFRPAGSDESDRPEVIHITPHKECLYLTFSWGGNRDMQVQPGMIGANHAELKYEQRVS